MDTQFWLDRWHQGLIGFHRDEVNEYLRKWFRYIELEPGSTVFVPMCGKSLDMLWLAEQGYQVVANELSLLAAEQFVSENKLACEITDVGEFKLYSMDNIKIYCGDFFNLLPEYLVDVALIYDRASLIALPEDMRVKYSAHMNSLFAKSTPGLLITLDYDQEEMPGPPFSVGEDEVRQHYHQVRMLQSFDVLADNKKFVNKGASRLQETVWLTSTSPTKE